MEFINEKLNEFNKFLKGKRIAILGLDEKNIPLINYMSEYGADVTVFDERELDFISKKVMDEVVSHGMKFSLGKGFLSQLKGFNLIFRSPKYLPTLHEVVEEAQRGAIITSEAEMVLELSPCTTIGVTGSEGKTTTATFISKILTQKGYNCFLDISDDVSLFTKIKDIRPDDKVVIELSSFQLMGVKTSPNIAIVTNLFPKQFEIHSCPEEYIDAKKNIFRFQKKEDLLILNYDNPITKDFSKEASSRIVYFSSQNSKLTDGYIIEDSKIKLSVANLRAHLLDTKELKIIGHHNYENIACAIAATREYCDINIVKNALMDCPGVDNRMELVKETEDRIRWFNDSESSTPRRTISGIDSFPFKNVILIAGGDDEFVDYAILAKPILDNCKNLILIGKNALKIKDVVDYEIAHSTKLIDISICSSLEGAVKLANEISAKGDIVLFSPASYSDSNFENKIARGNKFKELVNKIVK